MTRITDKLHAYNRDTGRPANAIFASNDVKQEIAAEFGALYCTRKVIESSHEVLEGCRIFTISGKGKLIVGLVIE